MNTTAPIAVPVRDLAPALLLAAFLLLAVYVLQFDQGAVSQTGSFVHELVHDARHLLGVPCH
jgi:hypothetical protein